MSDVTKQDAGVINDIITNALAVVKLELESTDDPIRKDKLNDIMNQLDMANKGISASLTLLDTTHYTVVGKLVAGSVDAHLSSIIKMISELNNEAK